MYQDTHHHNMRNVYRRESMTGAPPEALQQSMTSIPPHYQQRRNDTKNKEGAGFFKRFLFQWDARELERELQGLIISKNDLIDSSFQKSELGFFNLFFQTVPLISISLLSLFIAFLIYIVLARVSIYLAIGISFLFMQITIFNNAKIIYRLDEYKIGEKTTGRFIKIVRTTWHVFEYIYLMILIGIGMLYYFPINFNKVAKDLLSYKFSTPVYQYVWAYAVKFLKYMFIHMQSFIGGLFLTLLLFLLTYIIGAYLQYKKANKKQKVTEFKMQKEIKNPADLARDKFDF